ncbi:MAG: hypothetical protein CVV39_04350, partial [Planctomycetes bacterium HGW-Planctomycetes-1]
MRHFDTPEEFSQYITENNSSKKFLDNRVNRNLSQNSFKNFIKTYQKNKRSAFSERVFACWIMDEHMSGKNFKVLPTVQDDIKVLNGTVNKRIDFSYEGTKRQRKFKVLIEFKCNIDLIEKDLYKFYLIPRCVKKLQIIKCLFIWEWKDNWTDKNGQPSSYAKLLEHAQRKGFLNQYFYFSPSMTFPHLLYHYELEYPALINPASTGIPVENFTLS